jgi:hypothetical protein
MLYLKQYKLKDGIIESFADGISIGPTTLLVVRAMSILFQKLLPLKQQNPL